MSEEFPNHLADQFLEEVRQKPTATHSSEQLSYVQKKTAETNAQVLFRRPPYLVYNAEDIRLHRSYPVQRVIDAQFIKGMRKVIRALGGGE